MARRGPAPKPTRLKKLAGNPGKRRLPKKPIAPTGDRPACPDWLSPDARAEWERIEPLLAKLGLSDAADQMALAAYCQAAAELIIATRALNKNGRYIDVVVRDRKGKKVGTRLESHPALVGQREALGKLRQFLVEFGLSPAARARIEIDREKPGDRTAQDDLSDLILQFTKGTPTADAK